MTTISQPKMAYERVSINRLADALAHASRPLALDLETTGLDPRQDHIITIQAGTDRLAYVADMRGAAWEEIASISTSLETLARNNIEIIGHNLKFDLLFLAWEYGAQFSKVFDTMIAEQVITGGKRHYIPGAYGEDDQEEYFSAGAYSVSLKETARRYGLDVSKEERALYLDLQPGEPLTEAMIAYAAQDVSIPYQIAALQRQRLDQDRLTLINQIEQGALPAIVSMEYHGVAVDVPGWDAYIEGKRREAESLEAKITATLAPAWLADLADHYDNGMIAYKGWKHDYQDAKDEIRQRWQGRAYTGVRQAQIAAWKEAHQKPEKPKEPPAYLNLASPTQLRDALEYAGIFLSSTASGALERHAGKDEVITDLLEWRRLWKLVTSFGAAILDKVTPAGRIHPNYRQIGTITGRMSCASPNWQQLPSHEKGEDKIRNHVIAGAGHVLLIADYANIELRILAEMSQDDHMLALFASGADLHSETARMMFTLPSDADPKETYYLGGITHRAAAKTINFGLIYGMGVDTLAARLGAPPQVAQDLMAIYFSTYPKIKPWLASTMRASLDRGYTLTIGGRRQYLLNLPRTNGEAEELSRIRGHVNNQAKNSPIQGTSADITKLALALLYRSLPAGAFLTTAVHDEIIVECDQNIAETTAPILASTMQRAAGRFLRIVDNPLPDVAISPYWKKG